jgi:methionyl aminopeptidase
VITLYSPAQIAELRRAGELVAETFALISPKVRPGVALSELDAIAEAHVRAAGATPAYKGYQPGFASTPFPGTICASVNEEVCHGFPNKRKLRSGDIAGIDIGCYLNGWAGDACVTYGVGTVSAEAQRLMDVTKQAMYAGIAEVRPGANLGNIGAAIQEVAEAAGFSVVREMTGHGLGRKLHEQLEVLHWGRRGSGLTLRTGMVFTIEPMINEGRPHIRLMPDGWTMVTADRKRSAQYEHTVAVVDGGCEILTPWDAHVK